MPPPDLYASCPSDGRVLSYYAGAFDAVFVSLSPFIRPREIAIELFKPDTYPDRRTIVRSCDAVTWSEVATLSGLPSIGAVDVALRTRIRALREEYANVDFARRVDKACNEAGIVPPNEGEHSDLLHPLVISLFQELGHRWVWVGYEFCSQRKLHWIDDLKSEVQPTIRGHCNVFSPDKSILWSVHWDSHFSFLCSSRENLEEKLRLHERLEGFFCGAQTEVVWSVRG